MTKLASLPALPSVSSVRPQHACACGCGRLTSRTFAPGHDARLKGGVVRLVRGLLTIDQIGEIMGLPFAAACLKALQDGPLMVRWAVFEDQVEWSGWLAEFENGSEAEVEEQVPEVEVEEKVG